MDRYQLEKSFGPAGSFAGIVLLLAGVVVFFFDITGLLLLAIGAFVGLTNSATIVDYENRRVKLVLNLFGILPIGKWVKVHSSMKVGVKKSNRIWQTSSWSNRTTSLVTHCYTISLIDPNNRSTLPIKNVKSLMEARAAEDYLLEKLALTKI